MPGTMHTIDAGLPRFTGAESAEEKIGAIQNYLFMLQEELHYVLHNLGSENINDNSLEELKRDIAGSVTVDAANIRGKLTAAQIDVGDLRISRLYLPRGTAGGYDVAISAEIGGTLARGEINIGKGGTGVSGNFNSVNVYAGENINFQTSVLGENEALSIEFHLSGSSVYPKAGTWDVGTSDKPFDNVYADTVAASHLIPSGAYGVIGGTDPWYLANIKRISKVERLQFRDDGRAELTHNNTSNRINVKYAKAFCGELSGSGSTTSYPTLGSSDLPWIEIYGGKIILGFDTSTTLELTCNANGKLCVNGTPIH